MSGLAPCVTAGEREAGNVSIGVRLEVAVLSCCVNRASTV